MAVFLVILHIVICLVLYLLMRAGILKSTTMVVPLMFFVPVWGLGCFLVLELRSRVNPDSYEEVGIEKLKINDEIHKSILMDEDTSQGRVVPLEEALLVNDPHTRRDLMMEIMYADPGDYVGQLQEARMNDDTEVVHYAVTALTELQKDYDLEFQRMDRELAENPGDEKVLNDYMALIERYLESGLPEGSARRFQLRNYSDILEQRLENNENIVLWNKKTDADLKIGEYDAAYQGIQRMMDLWPRDERGYLRLIQYYALVRDRKGIDQAIDLIRKRGIYLSPDGRSVLQFWGGDAAAWEYTPGRASQNENSAVI